MPDLLALVLGRNIRLWEGLQQRNDLCFKALTTHENGMVQVTARVLRSALARGLAALPGVEIRNDVVFTQVCAALPTDTETNAWAEALRADGDAFASSSHWRGRSVLRFSVSNWGTDDAAVARTIDAARRARARVR